MQRELKILLSASALFMLAGGLFGPIYAIFVEEIGGDLLTAGEAYGAFSIAAGIMVLLIARWEDHVKHIERMVVLGYVFSCVGFIGYLLIRNPFDLFIVQIIFGIGEAINLPAYDALYSKHLDKGKFAAQWGAWEAMYYLVTGVAAVAGGLLASLYGFHFLFGVMLVLSLVGLTVSSLLVFQKKK